MEKTLLILITLLIFSCGKETVLPTLEKQSSDTTTVDPLSGPIVSSGTPSVLDTFFYSTLDDSISYLSDSIDSNNFIILDNGFYIRIDITNVDSIKVGSYSNQYLVSNANYGFILTHSVYVGDGSFARMGIGCSATQINNLEITKIEDGKLWMVFDVDWTYTHWLYTDRNKSGTITGMLNGFQFE